MSFLLTNPGIYYGGAATIMFISYCCIEIQKKKINTTEAKSSLLSWCIGSLIITIMMTGIFMSPIPVGPYIYGGIILTCLLTLSISSAIIKFS